MKIFLLVSILFLCSCKKEEFNRIEMLTNVAKIVIIPSFESFEQECKALAERLKKFQQTADEKTLKDARDQWIKTAESWHSCELFQIGKFRDSYISKRIYANPPKMEYVDRIVNSETKIDKALIQGRGANIAGLATIEYLLFDSEKTLDILQKSPRRMSYLISLGEALEYRAVKAAEMWVTDSETYKQLITSQGTDLSSGVSMIFNEMVALTEKIMMTRVGKPLGKQTEDQSDGKMFEAFKSKESLRMIKASLKALKNTFSGGEGKGFDDYLNFLERNDKEKLSPKIIAAFNKVDEAAAKIDVIEKALTEDTASVENLYSSVKALLVLLKVDAANKLAITVTFNDNDGD